MDDWNVAVLLATSSITVLGAPPAKRSAPPLPDAELARRIVGYWCFSKDGGKTCKGYTHYLASGVGLSCSIDPRTGKTRRTVTRYWAHHGQLCFTFVATPFNDLRGQEFCDTVLSLDDHAETFTDSYGDTHIERRLTGAPPTCPDGTVL